MPICCYGLICVGSCFTSTKVITPKFHKFEMFITHARKDAERTDAPCNTKVHPIGNPEVIRHRLSVIVGLTHEAICPPEPSCKRRRTHRDTCIWVCTTEISFVRKCGSRVRGSGPRVKMREGVSFLSLGRTRTERAPPGPPRPTSTNRDD